MTPEVEQIAEGFAFLSVVFLILSLVGFFLGVWLLYLLIRAALIVPKIHDELLKLNQQPVQLKQGQGFPVKKGLYGVPEVE